MFLGPLQSLDGALSGIPLVVRLCLYGLVLGLSTMLVYRLISPQTKIKAAKADMQATRTQMQAYQGDDPKEAFRLAKASLAPAFRQLALVLVPTLVSALPVIWMTMYLEQVYGMKELVIFFVALSVAAIAAKLVFKIA